MSELDHERVVLTERTVNLGKHGKVRRVAYVVPSDGADVGVEWGIGGGESEVVTLNPDDLDALCHWWLKQEAQESAVGSGAPLSDKALTDATANIELVIGIAEPYDARGAEAASLGLTAILDEMERLRGALSEAYALLDAEHIQR